MSARGGQDVWGWDGTGLSSYMKVKVAQLCPTLFDPIDYPGDLPDPHYHV